MLVCKPVSYLKHVSQDFFFTRHNYLVSPTDDPSYTCTVQSQMQPTDTFPPSLRRFAALRHGAQTDFQTLFDERNPFLHRGADRLWIMTRFESCCLDQRQTEISRMDQLPAAESNGSLRTQFRARF